MLTHLYQTHDTQSGGYPTMLYKVRHVDPTLRAGLPCLQLINMTIQWTNPGVLCDRRRWYTSSPQSVAAIKCWCPGPICWCPGPICCHICWSPRPTSGWYLCGRTPGCQSPRESHELVYRGDMAPQGAVAAAMSAGPLPANTQICPLVAALWQLHLARASV